MPWGQNVGFDRADFTVGRLKHLVYGNFFMMVKICSLKENK